MNHMCCTVHLPRKDLKGSITCIPLKPRLEPPTFGGIGCSVRDRVAIFGYNLVLLSLEDTLAVFRRGEGRHQLLIYVF